MIKLLFSRETVNFFTAILLIVLGASQCELDATKAAELSRAIRDQFRISGMNWISPKMLREAIDFQSNTKPILYFFTLRSCADCRTMLSQFASLDHSMLSSLSAQFHAVLVLDDYNAEFGPEYNPGGNNDVPRMLFSDPDGHLRLDLTNPRADKFSPYFYFSADEVIARMRDVLMLHQEMPISLAREGLPGSSQTTPISDLVGGSGQFIADLETDLPS
ncbi:hypothetical protein CEUSTIGMA_g6368.t1 [Chlamydomonas eustigma]|uniref:Thioredoxin-like fold domain-containing protein n=1 Tax=Chlamydomonas eustigma TaxID=1157962 RepID=A0A250X7N3_9CHLO|nr:hypothetical protein CEUSTIGMA_g6368.t1 [Chlamydomonas eustigma]|eukprot:GAX78929.1 hypothetical protein CEUSTIGMA_g6368.t1 [Chlamydomonas eustigma]